MSDGGGRVRFTDTFLCCIPRLRHEWRAIARQAEWGRGAALVGAELHARVIATAAGGMVLTPTGWLYIHCGYIPLYSGASIDIHPIDVKAQPGFARGFARGFPIRPRACRTEYSQPRYLYRRCSHCQRRLREVRRGEGTQGNSGTDQQHDDSG